MFRTPLRLFGIGLTLAATTLLLVGCADTNMPVETPTPVAHADHDGDHALPRKVADDAESKLYLTPAGKYVSADIIANGNQTASQKFKGIKAVHDLKPKSGDRICPITLTKANPQFSWVIDGKSYAFCCPPCVDEYVTLAKEKPEELREPDSYIQK